MSESFEIRKQFLDSLTRTRLRPLAKTYGVSAGGKNDDIRARLVNLDVQIPDNFLATLPFAGRKMTSNPAVINAEAIGPPSNKRKRAEVSHSERPGKRPEFLAVPAAGWSDTVSPGNYGVQTRSKRKRLGESDSERPSKIPHVTKAPPSTSAQRQPKMTIASLLCSDNVPPRLAFSRGLSAGFPAPAATAENTSAISQSNARVRPTARPESIHVLVQPLAERLSLDSPGSTFRPSGTMVDGRHGSDHWDVDDRTRADQHTTVAAVDNERRFTEYSSENEFDMPEDTHLEDENTSPFRTTGGKGKRALTTADLNKAEDQTYQNDYFHAFDIMNTIRKGLNPGAFFAAASESAKLQGWRTPTEHSHEAGPSSRPHDNRGRVIKFLWEALEYAYTDRPVKGLGVDLVENFLDTLPVHLESLETDRTVSRMVPGTTQDV